MESVIRALAVYLILLVVFRVAGRRSLTQITTFDLILALIISEAIQQALIDDDNSVINALLVVFTLVAANMAVSGLKQRSGRFENAIEGTPQVIFSEGRLHTERMGKERVDEDDILIAGRATLGVKSLDDIEYAVLERNGAVSVVPKPGVGS